MTGKHWKTVGLCVVSVGGSAGASSITDITKHTLKDT